MKFFQYAVCPHCEHPNVHVYNGTIAPHAVSLASDTQCSGSNLGAKETHLEPLNRHTEEFWHALQKAQGSEQTQPLGAPIFKTWMFSGIQFIAIPIDRGNVHILDALGGNYGSWMDVDEFRKRQVKGVLADWAQLGKATLSVRLT